MRRWANRGLWREEGRSTVVGNAIRERPRCRAEAVAGGGEWGDKSVICLEWDGYRQVSEDCDILMTGTTVTPDSMMTVFPQSMAQGFGSRAQAVAGDGGEWKWDRAENLMYQNGQSPPASREGGESDDVSGNDGALGTSQLHLPSKIGATSPA